MRLPGKKALVTGAASGIGKAVVNAFVHEGAEVTGADLEYCNAAPDSGEGPRLVGLDVTNQDDWEHLANELTSVDVVVACAGISHACHINESTLEDWRRIIDVNLTGAFLSVRYAARAMRQQKGGSIVLIGSASGVKASPGASAYCVSKAGLRMLVQVAALELRPHAIRVNCVSPAGVVTPMWQKMPLWQNLLEKHGSEDAAWQALGGIDPATPSLQRMAFPQEVAAAVVFLSSDESAHITGADLPIDAGYTL